MSNVITKDALAKIAVAKNLVKEYIDSNSERTVYLNDGTEFQIYLKNPFQTHLGIKIYVNDKSIGNMLVLRPGQSFWLDRFVDENSKFIFVTYKVEDNDEMRYAINKNGKVKVEFYHERENKFYTYPGNVLINDVFSNDGLGGTTYAYNSSLNCNATRGFSSSANLRCDVDASYDLSSLTASSTNASTTKGIIFDKPLNKIFHKTKEMETGRVEKGGKSNQQFEACNIDFEYFPFKQEEILILPTSRKQTRVEETRRKYCSQCGKKVSPKDKFCSNCGAKL